MSMVIVCAPDERAVAFGRKLGETAPWRCLTMEEANEKAIREATALVLVTPDYYTHACWQMKSWLARYVGCLSGKLCSCVTLCAKGGGGELAMRTIVSQLLPGQCLVYLCAVLCADGLLRPGGCAELRGQGLTPGDFCTKLAHMAGVFG